MIRHSLTPAVEVRTADEAELDPLARVWYDAWRDAHAEILPEALVKVRTLESFRERLQRQLPHARVAGPRGSPVGFCIVKDEELYQLFVAKDARGSGVAVALIYDGEARLAAQGVLTAWLACAIGNERAARFYEKRGWQRVGTMVNELDTPVGLFPLEVWRYEKRLSAPDRPR